MKLVEELLLVMLVIQLKSLMVVTWLLPMKEAWIASMPSGCLEFYRKPFASSTYTHLPMALVDAIQVMVSFVVVVVVLEMAVVVVLVELLLVLCTDYAMEDIWH